MDVALALALALVVAATTSDIIATTIDDPIIATTISRQCLHQRAQQTYRTCIPRLSEQSAPTGVFGILRRRGLRLYVSSSSTSIERVVLGSASSRTHIER